MAVITEIELLNIEKLNNLHPGDGDLVRIYLESYFLNTANLWEVHTFTILNNEYVAILLNAMPTLINNEDWQSTQYKVTYIVNKIDKDVLADIPYVSNIMESQVDTILVDPLLGLTIDDIVKEMDMPLWPDYKSTYMIDGTVELSTVLRKPETGVDLYANKVVGHRIIPIKVCSNLEEENKTNVFKKFIKEVYKYQMMDILPETYTFDSSTQTEQERLNMKNYVSN